MEILQNLILDGEQITVRFLAIDTPESVHPTKEVQAYGVEASNFTKEKLKNAQKIELEFDNNSDKTDKYNRYLAWVWVDGELLQDLLIKEGLAKVAYLYGDYKYTNQLQVSENIAKEKKLKIWEEEIQDAYGNIEDESAENTTTEDNSNEKNNKLQYVEEIGTVLILLIISIIIRLIRKKDDFFSRP